MCVSVGGAQVSRLSEKETNEISGRPQEKTLFGKQCHMKAKLGGREGR